MAGSSADITHPFQSSKSQGSDPSKVSKDPWNDKHALSGGADGQKLIRDSSQPRGAALVDANTCALTNLTGGALVAADVVAIHPGADSSVALADVQGSPRKFVVAMGSINTGTAGPFAQSGPVAAKAQGAIARGNYVRKSAAIKAIEDTGVACTAEGPAGALGIALTAAAAGQAVILLFDTPIPTSGGVPIGGIIAYGGGAAPNGYLIADGSAVSRTTFAALFAAIGTTWGPGDNASTFNLPDSRGRTIIGAGQGAGLANRVLGTYVGEEAHQLTIAELAAHGHGVTDPGHGHNISTGPPAAGLVFGQAATATGNILAESAVTGIAIQPTGSGTPHNTMQPSAVATAIIRAF